MPRVHDIIFIFVCVYIYLMRLCIYEPSFPFLLFPSLCFFKKKTQNTRIHEQKRYLISVHIFEAIFSDDSTFFSCFFLFLPLNREKKNKKKD